jgi:hypothetical protein
MRVNKNYWLAALGTLAVAGAMMLFSAHRIEAQFSQPVRVLNTSAGPVLNSRIDDPGRIPYIATVSPTCSGTTCAFFFPAVQAGHRVVIEHVSGFVNLNGSPGVLGASIVSVGGADPLFISVPPGTGNPTIYDRQILYYIDGGQTPLAVFTSTGTTTVTFNSGLSQTMTLVGYELDCAAAPCTAITNH